MRPKAGTVLGGVAVLGVVGAIVAGLLVIGPPSEQRARRLDDRRLTDLRRIGSSVDLFRTRHDRLPASLTELAQERGVSISVTDPDTDEPYAYVPADSTAYELCADFDLASDAIYGDPARDRWAHGSGRQCFPMEARRITLDQR